MRYFVLVILCLAINPFSIVAQGGMMPYFQKARFPYLIKGERLEKQFRENENTPQGYLAIDQTNAKKYFTQTDNNPYLNSFLEYGEKNTLNLEKKLVQETHLYYAKDILFQNNKGTAIVLFIEQMSPMSGGNGSSSVEAWLVCFDAQQKMQKEMKRLAGKRHFKDMFSDITETNDVEILETGEITITTSTQKTFIGIDKVEKTNTKSTDHINNWLK